MCCKSILECHCCLKIKPYSISDFITCKKKVDSRTNPNIVCQGIINVRVRYECRQCLFHRIKCSGREE